LILVHGLDSNKVRRSSVNQTLVWCHNDEREFVWRLFFEKWYGFKKVGETTNQIRCIAIATKNPYTNESVKKKHDYLIELF
jgi:hypothetical protein